MKFSWNKSLIRICVRDENSNKVDFKKINEEIKEKDLLSVNGRGIMIMRSYMDKVEFLPRTPGTEVILERKL